MKRERSRERERNDKLAWQTENKRLKTDLEAYRLELDRRQKSNNIILPKDVKQRLGPDKVASWEAITEDIERLRPPELPLFKDVAGTSELPPSLVYMWLAADLDIINKKIKEKDINGLRRYLKVKVPSTFIHVLTFFF